MAEVDGRTRVRWAEEKALKTLRDIQNDRHSEHVKSYKFLYEKEDTDFVFVQKMGELCLPTILLRLRTPVRCPSFEGSLWMCVFQVQKIRRFKRSLWRDHEIVDCIKSALTRARMHNWELLLSLLFAIGNLSLHAPKHFYKSFHEQRILELLISLIKNLPSNFQGPEDKNDYFTMFINVFYLFTSYEPLLQQIVIYDIISICKGAIKEHGLVFNAQQKTRLRNLVESIRCYNRGQNLPGIKDPNKEFPTLCSTCISKQGEESFKKCSACGLVVYCSRNCQKEHWKSMHKERCGLTPHLNENG